VSAAPEVPQPQIDFWFDRWPFGLLVVVVLIAIVTPIATAQIYSSADTWTGMATNFSATSLAFLIALAWDRRQRALAELQEAEAERRREEALRAREQERRETEAQRRSSSSGCRRACSGRSTSSSATSTSSPTCRPDRGRRGAGRSA
jgi:hypothetical protein